MDRNAAIDYKICYWDAEDGNEAAYLVGLLNAPALERAFAEARVSSRDFVHTPWERVPIPRFDAAQKWHRGLVAQTKVAERVAATWLKKEGGKVSGQVAASKRIREQLEKIGVLSKIDEYARKILPDQAAAA